MNSLAKSLIASAHSTSVDVPGRWGLDGVAEMPTRGAYCPVFQVLPLSGAKVDVQGMVESWVIPTVFTVC